MSIIDFLNYSQILKIFLIDKININQHIANNFKNKQRGTCRNMSLTYYGVNTRKREFSRRTTGIVFERKTTEKALVTGNNSKKSGKRRRG